MEFKFKNRQQLSKIFSYLRWDLHIKWWGDWLVINGSADYGDYPSRKSSCQGRSTPLEIPRSDRDVLVMTFRNRTTSQRPSVIRGGWWEIRESLALHLHDRRFAGRAGRWEAAGATTKTGRPPVSFIYWAGRNTLFFVNCSFFIGIFCVPVIILRERGEWWVSLVLSAEQNSLEIQHRWYWPARLAFKCVFE